MTIILVQNVGVWVQSCPRVEWSIQVSIGKKSSGVTTFSCVSCWLYLIMIINVFNLFHWYISIQLKYSSHERDILKRKLEERVGLQLVYADRPQTSKLYGQVGFVGHIIQSTGGSSVLTKLYYSGPYSVHTGKMLKLYWDTSHLNVNNIFCNTTFP